MNRLRYYQGKEVDKERIEERSRVRVNKQKGVEKERTK